MGRTIEAPKTIQAIQIAATQEPFTPHPVITEGVVTWDDPKEATRFYLQDKTGGILVTARSPALLRSGDFVKVTGIVNRGPFSPVIEQAAVQKAGVDHGK